MRNLILILASIGLVSCAIPKSTSQESTTQPDYEIVAATQQDDNAVDNISKTTDKAQQQDKLSHDTQLAELKESITEGLLDGKVQQRASADQKKRDTSDFSDEEDELYPHTDLWQRIRDNFSIAKQEDRKRLKRQIDWYAKHPQYMKRVTQRAVPYLHLIVTEIENSDVPMEIALLPIVESAFKPFAYSHGRAAGIWQFIPATGKRYGLKQNWWYDGRRDVYASTRAAIKLLSNLAKEFDGDWLLALAAYNSGEGNVRRAVRKNKRRGKPTDFWSLHLPRETRAYVPKLIALKRIIANPDKYNISLTTIADEPQLKKVTLPGQIDLAKISELAGVSIDEVYNLNPAFNRWATSPNGPHYILLPLKNSEEFTSKLATLPREQRVKWVRHRIRKGQTISDIAAKYNTSISSIKRANHLRGNFLREGRSLTIPVASKRIGNYKHTAELRRSKKQNIPRKGIKVTHIVQHGDTFWRLAQHHRVGVRQLASWNSMAPRDPLKPGQKLIIWSRTGKKVAHNAPDNLVIPPHRKIMQRVGYYVRKGDSLARIASKFRVSIQQLLRWNTKLRSNKYIQPGQRITLYVDVTRQSS